MDVTCPKCGRTFQAPDDAPDHKLRCSECGTVFAIENGDANASREADTDLE